MTVVTAGTEEEAVEHPKKAFEMRLMERMRARERKAVMGL